MIREAVATDIPEIVRLGSESLKAGPYKDMLKDSPEHSAKLALQVITNADGRVLLLEENGKVVGLLGFLIFPHYFTGEKTASEIMWFVEEHHRCSFGAIALLRCAERKARELGAKHMGLTAPNEDIAKIYTVAGYKPVETSYMKEL